MSSKSLALYHGKSVKHTGSSLAKTSGNALVSDGRAFHVGDYRRAAAMVKGMRKDQHGKAKSADQQARVDMLAAAMAAVFEADSHEFGCPFSPGYFVAGTQL